MNRRGFITALLGTAAAITYGDELALPLDATGKAIQPPLDTVPAPSPWRNHYCYLFRAEMRGNVATPQVLTAQRNYWCESIAWDLPYGAIVGIQAAGKVLARAVMPSGIQRMSLIVPVFVPAGENLTITLQNLLGNYGPYPACLMLSGVQEITEAEAHSAAIVDAEFDEESEDDSE